MTTKNFRRKDAALAVETPLPNAGNTSVFTGGLDLDGKALADFELLISAPALTSTELPDGQTETYELQHADNSDFSDASSIYGQVLQQTGAGGAGAPAATKRVRLPSDVKRYVRLKISSSATAGDASGKKAKLEVVA